MKTIVIDTSVAVKWFSHEEATESALLLRDAMLKGECRVTAPDLLLYELANALRHNPNFAEEDIKLAVRSVCDMSIEFAPAENKLIEQAIEVAFHYKITVYDGCFLALAGLTGFPLLTADIKLIEKAGAFPNIINLFQFQP